MDFFRKLFLYVGSALIGAAAVAFFIRAKTKPWPPRNYAEARAFLYNLEGKNSQLLIDGVLNSSVVDPAGVKLNSDQVQRMTHALLDPRPVISMSACMFHPRHGVVFYDEQHQPIAWAEICLECQMRHLVPEQKHNAADWPALRQVFRDAGLPVFESPTDYDVLLPEGKRQVSRIRMFTPTNESEINLYPGETRGASNAP